MTFNKNLFTSHDSYGNGTCNVDEGSCRSIENDLEQLRGVESSKAENKHVFEDGNGRVSNTLAVEDNDGEEEQAPKYPQEKDRNQNCIPIFSGKARKLTAQVLKGPGAN